MKSILVTILVSLFSTYVNSAAIANVSECTANLVSVMEKRVSWNELIAGVENETNLNCRTFDQNTPLILATMIYDDQDRFNITNYLIQHGADIHSMNIRNESALFHAVRGNGSLPVVRMLVELGANINAVSTDARETPLMHACNYGKYETVEYLINKMANITAVDSDGNNALHYAVASIDIIRLLVEHGSNINATDNFRITPLMLAASKGNLETVEYLVNETANVVAVDMDNESALHYATVHNASLDIVRFLVEHGANINETNVFGETPLIFATNSGAYKTVKYLLDKKANVNTLDANDKSALMIAITAEASLDIVKQLVEHGANIHEMSQDGNTPLKLAEMKGNTEIVNYLRNAMKKKVAIISSY